MAYAANVHVAVYQVLDGVLGTRAAPPGAKALIHSIIDDMRSAAARAELIKKVEDISLQLHHLECALVQCDANAAVLARRELRSIAASWLDHRISGAAAKTRCL